MNNHKIEAADKTSIVTHTRIGDKNLNIYSGKWHIPDTDLPEFYKLYKDFVFVKKNKEYLTEKQMQSGGSMAVDLDFRYSSHVLSRQHNSSHVEDIVCAYCDEIKKYFSFDNNTKFYIWIFEKPNVNILADNSLTKDGIHLIFGLSVPYSIQLQIRKSLIENCSDLLKNLPLINTMESVLDEGISKGTTNWQLFGSCKPANQAYEMVTKYEIGFDETDGEITMEKVNFNMLDDFEKISVQCQAPAFKFNSSVDIDGDSVIITPHAPACENGITDATNYDELKFYSENGAFAYAMKSGCHLKWISLAGMLVSVLPVKEAFECWEIATLKNGTSNKKTEYEAKFKDIKMLEEDPIKAMNTLKKIVKKEAPTIFNNWKIKQKDILNEWKNKICEDIKAQKEQLRLQKEAEKAAKEAAKEAEKAEKEEKRNEKDVFMEKRKNENIFIDSDNEACDIIFEHLKHTIIYVNDRFYYKYKNCWIKDKDKISALLIVFIAESNIYKINDKYDLKPYGQNTKTAKNIMELLYAKVRVKCSTNIKYSLFHSSTKKKLCFLDGVLDFVKKTFTLWAAYKGNPIYTTVIIQRNFASYFNNPNRHFIDKIKNDIFYNLFGSKTTLALKFFARAIAGCCEDKNFMSYSGNRNSGKGILYTGMAASFEEYVTSFNMENMLCKRENNKSSDLAKDNAWLLNFEFARVAVAQETDENENDNIKNSLKINNKVMKTIMSGGDEIQARALYQETVNITLDATLGFFGNNELAISGEDSNQHHFKFNGVKQFITQEKYDSYKNMGDAFLSAYAVRDDNLKDTVKTDDYINAMVYLLYENFENRSLTLDVIEHDDDEEIELNIRALIFTHYEITKNDKDRVSKNNLFELLKKDKKKIKAELKQLGCIGGDTCKITIDSVNDEGEITKKQIPAFKNLKLKL
jgi:hypothetical protein